MFPLQYAPCFGGKHGCILCRWMGEVLRGGGGVKGQNLDFFCFNICCSPTYEDSKMGSLFF